MDLFTLADYQRFFDEGRLISITERIDRDQTYAFRRQLREVCERHPLNSGETDIAILLETKGGLNWVGLTLHNEIRALSQVRPVWLVCQARVASAGVTVAMAVPPERRVAFPHTRFYLHKGTMPYEIKLDGDETIHRYALAEYGAHIDDYLADRNMIIRLLVEGTRLTQEQASDLIDNPRHIYEEEAVELALVSRVLA